VAYGAAKGLIVASFELTQIIHLVAKVRRSGKIPRLVQIRNEGGLESLRNVAQNVERLTSITLCCGGQS
jgi:hypothetical protein